MHALKLHQPPIRRERHCTHGAVRTPGARRWRLPRPKCTTALHSHSNSTRDTMHMAERGWIGSLATLAGFTATQADRTTRRHKSSQTSKLALANSVCFTAAVARIDTPAPIRWLASVQHKLVAKRAYMGKILTVANRPRIAKRMGPKARHDDRVRMTPRIGKHVPRRGRPKRTERVAMRHKDLKVRRRFDLQNQRRPRAVPTRIMAKQAAERHTVRPRQQIPRGEQRRARLSSAEREKDGLRRHRRCITLARRRGVGDAAAHGEQPTRCCREEGSEGSESGHCVSRTTLPKAGQDRKREQPGYD